MCDRCGWKVRMPPGAGGHGPASGWCRQQILRPGHGRTGGRELLRVSSDPREEKDHARAPFELLLVWHPKSDRLKCNPVRCPYETHGNEEIALVGRRAAGISPHRPVSGTAGSWRRFRKLRRGRTRSANGPTWIRTTRSFDGHHRPIRPVRSVWLGLDLQSPRRPMNGRR